MGVPPVSDWLDMMSDVVTIYAWVSPTASGGANYSTTGIEYPAYIEMKNHLIVDTKGRQITARGRVFMATTTVPGLKDKIVLPGRFVPASPPILGVNSVDDETGTHHVTLEIG